MSEETPTPTPIPGAMVVASDSHDPNPVLVTTESPDGDGELALIRIGEHQWTTEELPGPRELAQRHTFATIRSFVRWLRRWSPKPERSSVLARLPANLENLVNCEAEIDARVDPRRYDGDRVTCFVPLDPTFRAWTTLAIGGRIPQRKLFAFLRAYGHALASPEAATHLLGALASVRVSANASLECELAPNGLVRVTGQGGDVALTTDLPSELELSIPVYTGVRYAGAEHPEEVHGQEAEYSVRALLEVEADPVHGLTVAVSFPELETTLSRAADDLAAFVEAELGWPFLVGVGCETSEAVSIGTATGQGQRPSDPGSWGGVPDPSDAD